MPPPVPPVVQFAKDNVKDLLGQVVAQEAKVTAAKEEETEASAAVDECKDSKLRARLQRTREAAEQALKEARADLKDLKEQLKNGTLRFLSRSYFLRT